MILEWKKLARTGFVPGLLCAALLAAAFPAVNMAVRSDVYTALDGSPLAILLDANWQLMAMLNLFASVLGACILYHIEYAGGAMQKMDTLPLRPGTLFLRKFAVLAIVGAASILLETASLWGCCLYWFGGRPVPAALLLRTAGMFLPQLLPTQLLLLALSSLCRNLWVSLGIGVILIFMATILPLRGPVLSLLPFAAPFETGLASLSSGELLRSLCLLGAQLIVFAAAGLACQKIRRCM